jgi:hypothetical protein
VDDIAQEAGTNLIVMVVGRRLKSRALTFGIFSEY